MNGKKQARVKCECGAYLSVRRLIRRGVRECPNCGSSLSGDVLEKIYGRDAKPIAGRGKKPVMITLNCLCGASYKIERPEGDFVFPCKTCGRILIQARVGVLNLKGVNTFGEQA